MHVHHRGVALGLASILIVGSWASGALPVAAAPSCVGTRANFFDGKVSLVETYGSSARISTVYPLLCSGASTFSNAWSMLTTAATLGWAQSGYIREYELSPTTVYYFAQWKRASGYAPNTLYTSPGPAAGNVVKYKTTINVDGYVEMYRGSTIMARSGWKPSNNWGPQPWSNQYFGETGHCETDVPGLEWNRAHFTDVSRQTWLQGAWINATGLTTAKDCGSRYQLLTLSPPSSVAFDIWSYTP